MRTEILDGEEILKTVEGYFDKDGVCLKGVCFITTRRLIFEQPDREIPTRLKKDKKFAKNLAVAALTFGGAVGDRAIRNMEIEEGRTVYGRNISVWFDEAAEFEISDTTISAIQTEGGRIIPLKFEVTGKDRLTLLDQEKLQEVLKSACSTDSGRERTPEIGEMVSFLKEINAKKGFLKPEQKLEYDISRTMANGKTREEAIRELYGETKR